MKILTTLLDIVTAFLSLPQAEGRILKRAVMNVAWTLAFVGIATLLVLAAVGFSWRGSTSTLPRIYPLRPLDLRVVSALVLALIFAGVAKWWPADPA
jgi:hypothetical protein